MSLNRGTKIKVRLLVGAALPALFLTEVLAQSSTTVVAPIGRSGGGTLVNPPQGNNTLNFTNQNITQVIDTVTSKTLLTRKEDREYLESQVNGFDALIKSIQATLLPKLGLMSGLSQTGTANAIQIDKFVELAVEYERDLALIQSKMESIKAMASGLFPATEVSISEGKRVSVPSHREYNLDKLVNYFENQILEIKKAVSAKSVIVVDRAGVQNSFTLANIDYSKITIMTDTEIRMIQGKIDTLRTSNLAFMEKQDQLSKEIGKLMYDFVISTGAEERWRRKNANDIKDQGEWFERIAELMIYKQYMRVKTGLPQGAIGVEFTKQAFNREKFLMSPWEFIQLYNFKKDSNGKIVLNSKGLPDVTPSMQKTPIRATAQLNSAKEAYRNLLETNEEKAQSIFDGKSGLIEKTIALISGNVDLIAKANSFVTWISGRRDMMEANREVLHLLADDLYQEIQVLRGNGHDLVRMSFKQRYLENPETKKKVLSYLCGIDRISLEQVCNGIGFNSPTANVLNPGDVTSTVKGIITDSSNVIANLGVAATLQAQLDKNKLRNNSANTAVDKGVNDLFR